MNNSVMIAELLVYFLITATACVALALSIQSYMELKKLKQGLYTGERSTFVDYEDIRDLATELYMNRVQGRFAGEVPTDKIAKRCLKEAVILYETIYMCSDTDISDIFYLNHGGLPENLQENEDAV